MLSIISSATKFEWEYHISCWQNHILRTPTKKPKKIKPKKKKKTQKDPKNPRLNHEITKSKIGQRDTEESKKQKR